MPRDDLWAIAFLAAVDMDDISGFSLLHARQNALDREKCRGEIAVNRCAPPFLGCLLQRAGHGEAAASVGDQNIDRAQFPFDLAPHGFDVAELRRIARDLTGASASAPDVG